MVRPAQPSFVNPARRMHVKARTDGVIGRKVPTGGAFGHNVVGHSVADSSTATKGTRPRPCPFTVSPPHHSFSGRSHLNCCSSFPLLAKLLSPLIADTIELIPAKHHLAKTAVLYQSIWITSERDQPNSVLNVKLE